MTHVLHWSHWSPFRQNKYIFVCTHYLNKWVKVKAVKVVTKHKVVEFLRENIFYKFSFPRELVIEQSFQFASNLIEGIMDKHNIRHLKSTLYQPKENGLVEVTNKALESTLTMWSTIAKRTGKKDLLRLVWPTTAPRGPPHDLTPMS